MSEYDPTVVLTKVDEFEEEEHGFEFDEEDEDYLFELMEGLNQEDLEDDKEEEFSKEHIDLENAFKFDVPGEKQSNFGIIREKEIVEVNAPPGRRFYRDIDLFEYDENCLPEIVVKKKDLVIRSVKDGKTIKEYIVGKAKTEKYISSIPLNVENVVEKASIYNEEVRGKGSGLGYSSFLHLCACIIVVNRGILEPIDGCDVKTDGILIEVTGNSFEFRKTKADWVINKYLLFTLLIKSKTIEADIIKLSMKEDHYETDYFLGGSIDNGPSPYTPVISDLHEVIRMTTNEQFSGLKSFHLKWYKEQVRGTTYNPDFKEASNPDKVIENMTKPKAAKISALEEIKYPCCYKVLMFDSKELEADELKRRIDFKVNVDDYESGSTTFRTLTQDKDPEYYCKMEAKHIRIEAKPEATTIEELLRRDFGKYCTIQAAEIEAELLGKIQGKKGNFYSKYSKIGISWNNNGSGLYYNCIFYSFEPPCYGEDVVGKYFFSKGIYRSSVFKASLSFIRFSTLLPAKLLNIYITIQPMIKTYQYKETLMSLLVMFNCWRWSSWQTSKISGNSRYITTCHINRSGNLQALIDSQVEVNTLLSFPDFLYLHLCKKYITSPKRYDKTPLFSFPLVLLSLEKDLPLGMNWHIRVSKHSTRCMSKVLLAARYDQENRHERLKYLKLQWDFLTKMQKEGCSYDDYKVLMDQSPDFPHLNIVYFMAIVKINENDLESTGLTQESTDFCIQKMVSGSNNLSIEDGIAKNRKVFMTMGKLPESKGAHELLIKLNKKNEKIRNIFSVHAKDQKSGDRDIEQMTIETRPFQLARESLISIVSKTVEVDHMKDTSKHLSFVEGFGKILRSKLAKGLTSEDRSFHSGYNYPEEMSLAYIVIAIISGNTSVVTSSAIQRMNTHRDLIFPFDYDLESQLAKDDLEGIENISSITREQSKSFKKVPVIRMYAHFLQGIDVIGASVINSMKTAGDINTVRLLYDGIEETFAAVTSDDVGKGMTIKPGYNSNFLINAALIRPLEDCKKVMMLNNEKKFSCVESSIEINNTCITRTGMVSQGPIFSVLVNQPLKSTSIVKDIMQIVSDARSTIFWGDSPSLSMSALQGGKSELRSKWLLTESQVDFLEEVKLLPRSLEELISGFFPRDLKVFEFILSRHSEEEIPKLKKGIISLMGPFAKEYSKKTKKKILKVDKLDNLPRRSRNIAERIRLEVDQGDNINLKWAKPMKIEDRKKMRDDFLKAIVDCVTREIEIKSEVIELYELLRPPDVTVSFRRMRRSDTYPSFMGSSSYLIKPDMKRIRCKKFLGFDYQVNYSHPSTDYPIEAFEEFEFQQEVQEKKSGIGFKSAPGLPLVKFINGKVFKQPYVFNFNSEFKVTQEVEGNKDKVFYYEGNVVVDFKASQWSNHSLLKCKKEKAKVLCFGTGRIGGQHFAFYQRRTESIKIKLCEDKKGLQIMDGIAILNGIDTSLLDPRSFQIYEFDTVYPGLSGDDVAIYNYMGYSRSNMSKPFKIFRKLFHQFDCVLPTEIQKFYPDFPYNVLNCDYKLVNGYGNYKLIGSKCIYKTKFEFKSMSKTIADVVLSGLEPIVELYDITEEQLELL